MLQVLYTHFHLTLVTLLVAMSKLIDLAFLDIKPIYLGNIMFVCL